jgi:2-oxoglutarate ferredoxin oxidoreductase subunit alpha
MTATPTPAPAPTGRFIEGSEALVEASIAAGCRFFAGYPMTPFTEVLEGFARRLPEIGGVCMNAESELEAIGMVWGAAATGTRSATGSTGQGLALMQESFSEMTLAQLPIVVFNMSRGQSDYFQSTRGGGHGDYRHLVLAPIDVDEAVALIQLAFDLADRWRHPVLLYGDYLLAHTWEVVDIGAGDGDGSAQQADNGWAVAGNAGRRSRHVTSLGQDRFAFPEDAPGAEGHLRAIADKQQRITATEQRWQAEHCKDADVVVVAFGTLAKFVRFVVRQLRADGRRVGFFRPVSLWPFPHEALAAACRGARRVAVYENNAGQMVDDVRIGVAGAAPVEFVGEISTDESGFGVGTGIEVDHIRARIEAMAVEEAPA